MSAIQSLPRTPATLPIESPPLSVLILDDERFDRHRLARLCSALPFPCQITNAQSLTEFSDCLAEHSFGLILIDFALPDGTGLDAMHQLRLSPRNLDTPSLMISGQAADRVGDQVRALGCSECLTKDDLTPARFAEAVTAALDARKRPGPTLAANYAAPEAAQLLALCARRCAGDIKPMVSRMLRQLRDLRASGGTDSGPGIDRLEQNCMSLWAFLVEMERQEGADLLSDLAGAAPLPRGPETAASGTPKRPPSVFGWRSTPH